MNQLLKKGVAYLLILSTVFCGNFFMWKGKKAVQAAVKEDIRLEGIDVSHHQKQIDWEEVKDAGIDYAIIRCGYGQDVTLQDDLYWKANTDGCTKQNIPFGVYLYSYATTVEAAQGEADHVLRLIEGYDLQYPVYYDIEYSKQKDLGAVKLGQIASAFAEKIEAAGYQVGIYASYDWFQNYLTDPVFEQWERWVARYNTYCGYGKSYSMWQYSSEGEVAGIDGKVDMDYVIGTGIVSKVKEISLELSELELKIGQKTSLTAEVLPKNAFNKNITWSSSDEKVATISGQGEMEAVGEGTVNIVASSLENGNITANCRITVKGTENPKPTEIPEVTSTPEPTEVVTEIPEVTSTPESTIGVTEVPEATSIPETAIVGTNTPEPTMAVTETPKPTEMPEQTTAVTETPKPTEMPEQTIAATETPKSTQTPTPTVTVETVKGFSYQAVSKNQINLSWKKVSDAEGYVIYRYDSEKQKDISIATIKDNQTVDVQIEKVNGQKGKKLSPGTVYTFKVVAYKTVDDKKYYSKKVKIAAITKPDTVKIKQIKRTSATKAKLDWKNVSRATGYVVYVSDTQNGTYQAYKTVIGKSKKTIKISGLKKNKAYYVRVCAYLKYGDKTWYGNYYKTIKIPAK